MQHALKLLARDLAYNDLIKDPALKSKLESGVQMNKILKAKNLPDDARLKLYRQYFHRYRNVSAATQDDSEQQLGAVNSVTPTAKKKPAVKAVTVSAGRKSVRKRKPPAGWQVWN